MAYDESEVLRLFREDMQRTGYGLYKDTSPPPSLVEMGVREDEQRRSAVANNWQARIAHHLTKRGFLLKEIAFGMDCSVTHVHRLLTHILPNARKLR